MELDELRADWEKLAAPEKAVPVPDIRKAGRDLHSPVRHMLRNLRFEAILLFVTYLFVIGFYFFAFRGWMKEISWFTLSIGLVFAIYYYKKSQLLKSLERMEGSLHANLEGKLDTLGRYVHLYVWAGTLLGPLTLAFIGWLARKKIPEFSPYNAFFASEQNPLWKAALAWLIAGLAITALLYVLNIWYVDKLYGKYIPRLRSVLQDMKEDEKINLQP